LISLKIQNLILIENAEISFGPSLNVLTGETGSGKSIILYAIHLISGARADVSCIRDGANLAVVEALFENNILVRREIHRSGKNRCFINDELTTLSALKELSQIEIIDQNSASQVFERQKQMLDAFAGIEEETALFEKAHSQEKVLEAKLITLLQIPKERELEWAQKDLAWIEEINWQEGEEEKLDQEHRYLTHVQDLCQKMQSVSFTLSEENILPTLKRILATLESCSRIDTALSDSVKTFKSALLELEETSSFVQSYTDRLEAHPERLAFVEKRIADIEMLKKRFGANPLEHKQQLLNTIDRLSNLEEQIEETDKHLQKLKAQNLASMQKITGKRKESAPLFAQKVLSELICLNIPHAQFIIKVGDAFNDINFLFSANLGIDPLPLQECASGGEVSRVLLAIKTVLSEGSSTLVFDEIDSNVGGQTASIVGEKLKLLSEKRQVICVTHFVQVAKHAMDHFLVFKKESEKRVRTLIEKLDETSKKTEYSRMMG
jgi:DNA repair protein RecN (Recombination protein N)